MFRGEYVPRLNPRMAGECRTILHSDESGAAPSDRDGYPQVEDSARVTSRAGDGIRTHDVQLGNLCVPFDATSLEIRTLGVLSVPDVVAL